MSVEQLGQLIEEHSAALVLLARSLCKCPEDVVQEAFLELSRQQSWPDSPKAWLYRVVRNGAHSASRSARRRSKYEASAAVAGAQWFISNSDNLMDASIAAEALEELPSEQREVVIMRIWSRMTFQEIGDLTQTSVSTAQRRYVNALQALRKRLEPPCEKNLENQNPKPRAI